MIVSLEDINFAKDQISLYEYVLALVYIFLILIFSFLIRERFYKNSPIKKYMIPGILVKIVGAITLCMIYNYYYVGGDTMVYYNEGRLLNKIFINDPIVGTRLFWASGDDIPDDLMIYVQGWVFGDSKTTFLIIKISAFVQFFAFQSFLLTSILFGFLSFWGIWRIFKLLAELYPGLEKQLALSFLFLPSIFFWGSGILKDTVCLASLCIFFCSAYDAFIIGKKKVLNIFYLLITFYLIMVLKIYIIMSFAVCITILIFLNYRSKIRSQAVKNFLTPIVIFFSFIFGFVIIKFLGENSLGGTYSIGKILETAQITREYIYSTTLSAGKYSLGEFDDSIWGLISLFPAAVNVTLFRPYIWEAHNFIAFFASLENLFIFFITLKIIITTGIFRFFKIIASNNLIFFCMIFTLIFAYAIGLTSANFGTLVRYKIPCMPFYLMGLYMIQYVAKRQKAASKILRLA
jgi:hypothetical protein